MTDAYTDPSANDAFEALKLRADALERQLQEAELHALSRLRQVELKAEAMRAGIVDLDGLRLIDPRETGSQAESLDSPVEVIGRLRRDKPWLFGGSNSSSVAVTPLSVPTKRRLATEMTLEEWRTARADLIRRR